MNHKNALLLKKKGLNFIQLSLVCRLQKVISSVRNQGPAMTTREYLLGLKLLVKVFTKLSNRWKCVEISATAIKKNKHLSHVCFIFETKILKPPRD